MARPPTAAARQPDLFDAPAPDRIDGPQLAQLALQTERTRLLLASQRAALRAALRTPRSARCAR